MKPTILVVGEINVDLICTGYRSFPEPGKEVLVDDFTMTLGSSSAICAMGLARLGNAVRFVGKVGADPWGDYCVATMRDAGIDVSRVVRDPAIKTGVTVSITSRRDRALVSYLGSIGALRAEDVDGQALDGADHLHISSYFLQQGLRDNCGELLARASDAGLSTSLDPGFDPAERWEHDLLDALDAVDLFFPNEVELRAITGEASILDGLRRLQNGRTRTIATLGAEGCATLDGDALLQAVCYPIATVDSTGAGDSFNAGFLHAWLRRQPIADCLRWGAACGSLSTRGLGGTSRQASVAEVEALLAASGGLRT
ncbi:carbohydrate kinase family protein [Lysobacter sp. CFH 32150]|uniref:carbohydrate kinase family protein n=1 Tax=Lysobacter sp. CFH 32150 TaxID=2927128 RepID=UPI001FA7EC45|nr:carbohydrate kinase family protein [Lysobacter sp. CFH 32150]MCI4568364.1 carbohydrate kinase family protein [Lysobacter sp. CFH 32150]